MRTVWTETALCVGMAVLDDVLERDVKAEKEHKLLSSESWSQSLEFDLSGMRPTFPI